MDAEPSDAGPKVRLAPSRSARLALLLVGHVFVAIGVVGVLLPGLPGTVFLIGAAACYARASTRLHRALLEHRILGPPVRDWEVHRAMAVRTKVIAISVIVVAFSVTVLLLDRPWARALHVITGVAVIGIILRIRTRRT